VSAIAALCALAASGCTAPFGPGYTIEKQRIEVTYSLDAPDRVAVRAWYQMKNTGTGSLQAISAEIPFMTYFAKNIRADWNDNEIPYQLVADTKDQLRAQLRGPWNHGVKGEFALSYDLPIVGDKTPPGFPSTPPFFFLPSAGWYPSLLPPKGTFSNGGKPPAIWNLIVNVPKDFRIHASGSDRGLYHSKRAKTESTSVIFEQATGRDFNPFVVAGPFQEQQIQSHGQTIFIWSIKSLADSDAHKMGEGLASETAFFGEEFGLKETTRGQFWVIQCPGGGVEAVEPWRFHADRSGGPWHSRVDCLTEPQSAYVGLNPSGQTEMPRPFVAPYHHDSSKNEGFLESADVQIASTWFYFALLDSPKGPSFPMAAAPDYAALSYTISQSPASRSDLIHQLLGRVSAADPEDQDATLISVDNSEAGSDTLDEIELARIRSELFFIALEDRCGSANLHHALARLVRILHGQTWGISDLRSAVEAECGTDLADFFRQLLNRPGIPGDFRARYAGSTVAAPKQPGQK